MIDVSAGNNPELYLDPQLCLRFLNKIDDVEYRYPPGVTIFHTYSEIKNSYELMIVKSYLATQNLDKTRMILWSDWDISDNPLIQPYKDYIELKVYYPANEGMGTILENRLDMLNAKDERHWLQSDLLRILVLYKYGGTWVDMDIVFLRDFKPLLDQEYLYSNHASIDHGKDGIWGTVMSLKKGSELSVRLLQELSETPIRRRTLCWGSDMFKKVYADEKFCVLPAMFFNPEYCIAGWPLEKKKRLIRSFIDGWFQKNACSKTLYPGTFSWHWHNSTRRTKKKPIIAAPGSKFALIEEIIDKKLQERGIHG